MPNALPQEAQPELEPNSRLSSKLKGSKNRLLKPSAKHQSGLDESHNGASGATPSFAPGSEPNPLDSAYDFGALAADSRDAGAAASTASRPSTGGSLLPGLYCCSAQSQGMHARLSTTVYRAAVMHIGFTSRAVAHTAGCKCISDVHRPASLSPICPVQVLLVAAAEKQADWHMLRSLCNIPS